MEYYNIKNEKITIDNKVLNEKIGHGYCATVYKYKDGLCLKIYDRKTCYKINTLETTVYEKIKCIDNPSLVEIKELLYKNLANRYNADAYILKYYEEKYNSILDVPSDYLLYSLEEILKLQEKLSKNRIRAFGLKRENVILNDKNIILIDPDRWFINYLDDESEILKVNINNIMGMFSDITLDSLRTECIDLLIESDSYYYASKLFPLTCKSSRALKNLERRLKGHENIKSYVYRKKK